MKAEIKEYFSLGKNSLKKSNPILSVPFCSRPRAGVDSLPFIKNIPCVRLPHSVDQNVSSETRLVEIVRNPEDPRQLLFFLWEGGKVTIAPQGEQGGKLQVPPETAIGAAAELRLPDRILPCGQPHELLVELSSEISKFVDLSADDLLLVSVFVLSSWFPDCVKAAPYLWLVGALGSGKTTLLRLLHCLCRRALLIGDVRGASVYKLSSLGTTLLLDEFESDNSCRGAEVRRLLRTGNAPGVHTARNGQLYSTFGHKVISSREPPLDAALASRAIFIRLLPKRKELLPLDHAACEEVAKKLQAKLLMFRLTNHSTIRQFQIPSALGDLTPRMVDLAIAMAAPLRGDALWVPKLQEVLRKHDHDARVERSLEPEWLVVEALFEMSHQNPIWTILVGSVATHVNERLTFRGEGVSVTARKVGGILKSIGMRTQRIGKLGRGFIFGSVMNRTIHELAQRFGIDRRALATLDGLESGYGGRPCALCEEFDLTGGLRFVDLKRESGRRLQTSRRSRLFDETKIVEARAKSTVFPVDRAE